MEIFDKIYQVAKKSDNILKENFKFKNLEWIFVGKVGVWNIGIRIFSNGEYNSCIECGSYWSFGCFNSIYGAIYRAVFVATVENEKKFIEFLPSENDFQIFIKKYDEKDYGFIVKKGLNSRTNALYDTIDLAIYMAKEEIKNWTMN